MQAMTLCRGAVAPAEGLAATWAYTVYEEYEYTAVLLLSSCSKKTPEIGRTTLGHKLDTLRTWPCGWPDTQQCAVEYPHHMDYGMQVAY